MTEVLPRPMSSHSTGSENLEVLVQTLDHLLERYLHLLYQHQTLQRDLAEQLSSGYFSLAQANYASPTRRRYGQDFYDERMKASTSVSINSFVPTFSLITAAHCSRSPLPEEDKSDRARLASLEVADDAVKNKTTFSKATVDGKAIAPPGDPLKWFGILIPPALRSAQRSFRRAAVDVVPALASVVHEMRAVEEEVRKTRERVRTIR